MSNSTLLIRCTCKSDGQDKLHGDGVRVHNKSNKSAHNTYKCTVCGNVVHNKT